MTDYFIRPRQTGKTYEILQRMLADPELYVVTANMVMADALWRSARHMQREATKQDPTISRDRFIAAAHLIIVLGQNRRIMKLAFDNIELSLPTIIAARDVTIDSITATGTNTRFRERDWRAPTPWTYSPKYRNKRTGTVYHRVDLSNISTGYITVETEAHSVYAVRSDSIEADTMAPAPDIEHSQDHRI